MTLRARLTWILLATLMPLGAAVGLGLYAFVRVALYARLDDALAARAEVLAAAVKWHNGELDFDFEDAAMPQYQTQPVARSTQAAYFELWRMQGSELGPLIERSKSMGNAVLVDRGRLADPSRRQATWNTALADGTDVRVLATRVTPAIERENTAGDAPATGAIAAPASPKAGWESTLGKADPISEVLVAVAMPRESVDQPLELLAVGLAIAGVVLAAAGFASLRWAIARGLAPVGDLAEQVANVDADKLGTRLAVPRLPPEIAPIEDRVNALLGRIEEAMHRERRFSSAAAHELRTPIAELRILLEVATNQDRTPGEWSLTAERALTVLSRTQYLCEALLRLSRAATTQLPANALVQTDIPTLIEEQVERALAMHDADRSTIRIECAPRLSGCADAAILGSMIGNLLDNAFQHGEVSAADPIVIRGSQREALAIIEISNLAPRLEPDDVARVFESFWQKDLSRHDPSRFGLGLAVARALAESMRGDLAASLTERNELTIRLSLPTMAEALNFSGIRRGAERHSGAS
jgi:signal transduction histidine kinase